MHTKFPSQVRLDQDEVYRINRIRIAEKFHVLPHMVDDMPASDVDDILDLMWADEQLAPKK